MWLKSTKMEARRCVRQSRDAHEAISEPSEGDGHPRLTSHPHPEGGQKHGDQGEEHEEEQGGEAGSKDAEREAASQEGEEVAGGKLGARRDTRLETAKPGMPRIDHFERLAQPRACSVGLAAGTRSVFEQAGFIYPRPKGKRNCVMRTTVAPVA